MSDFSNENELRNELEKKILKKRRNKGDSDGQRERERESESEGNKKARWTEREREKVKERKRQGAEDEWHESLRDNGTSRKERNGERKGK